MTKSSKTRACNILFVRALHCADFVTRETLESIIRDSVYASTVNKTMGYVNDLKFYHHAVFQYKKNNKTVTHVKMLNAHEFNHETGFPLTKAEKETRDAAIVDIAKNLAIETVTLNVSDVATLVMTSDNDIKMSDSLKIDESAIVTTTLVTSVDDDTFKSALADADAIAQAHKQAQREAKSQRMRDMNAAKRASKAA